LQVLSKKIPVVAAHVERAAIVKEIARAHALILHHVGRQRGKYKEQRHAFNNKTKDQETRKYHGARVANCIGPNRVDDKGERAQKEEPRGPQKGIGSEVGFYK